MERDMKKLLGKPVYDGVAIGKIVVLNKKEMTVRRQKTADIEAEKKRVEDALTKAKEQLAALYEKALKEVGEASAAIFEVHQMMLEDEDYVQSMLHIVENEGVNAEYAVATTGDNFAQMFAAMDDEYMQARSADIRDISGRVLRILCGQESVDFAGMEPSVIVADDLTPSETVQMDKSKILAFVTVHGSTNSHTAILARMMNIPALIGVPVNLEEIKTGETAIVDGASGEVIFSPTEEELAKAEDKIKKEQEKKNILETLKGKETVTREGKKINLYANIGSVSDV